MKKLGFLLLVSLILSGCASKDAAIEDAGYTCNVDQELNALTIQRGGKFSFPTAASRVQVFIYNNQINIVDYHDFEYTGYLLTKSDKDKLIEKSNDLNISVKKGDFYFENDRLIEIFSPKRKLFALYYFAAESNKISSIQFLTNCEPTDLRYQRKPYLGFGLDEHVH